MLNPEELNNIIILVQKGDQSAFEKLYDAYSSALYGISVKILGDSKEAEDAVQDTFIKVWKNIHSFDLQKGSFFTWILNINRNTAIDKYRKSSKKTLISIQSGENLVDLGKDVQSEQKINHIGLTDLLKVLPEKEQVILEYIYFRGFTQQETADELNLPLGTVKTRSRNALKGLKELFILLTTWI